MTVSKDGAPHLVGKLNEVGRLMVDFGYTDANIDATLYTFDGYNTESGDKEDPFVTFMVVDESTILSGVSAVYDVFDPDGSFTARVVVTEISF